MNLTGFSDAELKTQILSDFDLESDAKAVTNVEFWWKSNTHSNRNVQYLAARVDAIKYLLTKARTSRTIKIGDDTFSGKDKFANLNALLSKAENDLADARSSGGFKVLNQVDIPAYANRCHSLWSRNKSGG